MGQVATVSCMLAAGPNQAAATLAAALASTGRLGRPEAWFDPAAVPARAAALGVAAGSDFAPRYLEAVARAGFGPPAEPPVWSARASWTDMRWLLHALRLDPATSAAALDHEVVAARWPGLSYVLLVDDDQAGTAWRRAAGAGHQWVRWLEEAAARDEQSWRRFLHRAGVEALELRASDVETDPAGAVETVAARLGVEIEAVTVPPQGKAGAAGAPPEYRTERDTLSPWPIAAGVGA